MIHPGILYCWFLIFYFRFLIFYLLFLISASDKHIHPRISYFWLFTSDFRFLFFISDFCLLINTSIPGYHISLAYLPALNYSCDMDIRPISIYFMDHNSQNWTRYFISVLMLKHFKSHKPKQWLLDQNETEKFFSIWFSVQAHICDFITNDQKFKIYPKYICWFLLLLLVRSLNLWFMQTFVSIDILRCIFLFACLGYARFYTPPKSHVWPFTKFIEFSRGAIIPGKYKSYQSFWMETRHGGASWIQGTKVWNKSHWFETVAARFVWNNRRQLSNWNTEV